MLALRPRCDPHEQDHVSCMRDLSTCHTRPVSGGLAWLEVDAGGREIRYAR
jgi:hypothetical protein